MDGDHDAIARGASIDVLVASRTLAKTNHQPVVVFVSSRSAVVDAIMPAPPREPGDARDARATTASTAQRSTSRVVAREEYVVVDLPLELNDLPGDALKFSNLDTDRPRLRTIDGARYVGRYELTAGEQLIVGFPNARDADARVLATTERRVRFTPE